ncbi:3006_t:CDS:2, partial [Dentiscutata erythropus]
ILNKRSTETNVSSNYYIEMDSDDNILNQEDFDNEISDNEDFDNILTESSVLSEDDMLTDDDMLTNNDMFNTDSSMSKDNMLREVVDKSLCNEKMLLINGEFALYFSNFTEAIMFFWIKSIVYTVTQVYNDLVDIIYNLQFNSKNVIKNIRQFRKYRQQLPLLQIKSHQIHISDKLYQKILKWHIA